MAMSPSPVLSPSLGVAHAVDRVHSDTPPMPPLSKRDKRRTMVVDRLRGVTMLFNANKDNYYRQQLHAIQIDTALILHADPYRDNPITDLGDDIQELVHQETKANPQAMLAAVNGDVSSIAGKIYSEFANEVNDAMEVRDAALAEEQREYEKKLAQLNNSNQYMMKLAKEEHQALASTLRDRLINNVTGRRARLSKEKDDILNIGEANALLMHPNQFSIANPASPGGIHAKRATRHRREVDDIPGFTDGSKRKRRAADDIGSPVPTRRHLENGFSTPIWTSEQAARAANKGSHSPLYSIDKLFTERELAMTYNHAAVAAHLYMLTHKPRPKGSRDSPNDSTGSNSPGVDEQNVGDENNYLALESPPAAPLMERQYSHATRSTRGAGNLTTATGIDIISDLSLPGNFSRVSSQMPRLPPLSHPGMLKAYTKENANVPSGTNGDELQQDLDRIAKSLKMNEETGVGHNLETGNDRVVLQALCSSPGEIVSYLRPPIIENGNSKEKKNPRIIGLGEDGQGGVPMSQQSSMGGSEIGSVPMTRTRSGDGSSMGTKRRRN